MDRGHTESAHDRGRLEKWRIRNDKLINYVREHQPELFPGDTAEELPEDFVSEEEIDAVEKLDPAIHNLDHMIDDTYDDLDQLAEFLELVRAVKPERDDKLKALIKLLKSDNAAAGQKVLHPELAATLGTLPLKLFSGKEHPNPAAKAVFFCFRIPRPDPDLVATETGELRWSDAAGVTVWICSDLSGERLATDPTAIADLIRSRPETPRCCTLDRAELSTLRKAVEKELTRTHLRALQAPPGVTPVLKC